MTATDLSTATILEPIGTAHEHGWTTQSRHRTSEGEVLYVRCACGARRIDLQGGPAAPPTALSRPIPPRSVAG